MTVEEEHLDILQNIEFGVVSAYREHPDLVDFDVERVLDALLKEYSRPGGSTPDFPTQQRALLYARMKAMCDLRLGKAEVETPIIGDIEPVSTDVITACLKRLRRSVNKWSKRGGRQGYLNFIQEYVVQ